MSKWCDTCNRNEMTGKWSSCSHECPICGKSFEELAKMVIEQKAEIEALRWTMRIFSREQKEKRRNLWKKAVNQFAEKIRNGHNVEDIIEEMIGK